MTVRCMELKCACGGKVFPYKIFITRHKQIMINGLCTVCEKKVCILESLLNMIQVSMDIFKNQPPDDDEPDYKVVDVPAEPVLPQMSDADFLRMLHIEKMEDL